jgi:FtsH-binding integral membrane protein
MKTIAWLAGIGTLVAGAAYMIVSLNRWEWNRALFFGLIVLIAEVGLATALILRKLSHLEHRSAVDPATLATLRSTRPSSPDRFEWLKTSAKGQGLNVFITFLVAGGVLLSGVAWVVDQLGAKTSTPIGERRLAEKLGLISYPVGGLVVDDVTVLAQDTPGADDAQIRKLLGRPGRGHA